MADYWKSQARKFCDFCKCWIADNKPSVEFHENGKKHKENVSKRLKEIHKNSAKQAKQQQKFENDIEKMEKAAMAAYLKDVESNTRDMTADKIIQEKWNKTDDSNKNQFTDLNPNRAPDAAPDAHPRFRKSDYKQNYGEADIDPCDPFAKQKLARLAARRAKAEKKASKSDETSHGKGKSEKGGKAKESKPKEEASGSRPPIQKIWYEARTQGHSYYWNIETNESVWEPPPEGFMSLEEQAEEVKEQTLQEELFKQIDKEEEKEIAERIEEQRAYAEREKLREIGKRLESKNIEKKNNSGDEMEESEEEKIPYRRDYSVPDKPQPYGSWQVVRKTEVSKIDLQLPQVKPPSVPTINFEPEPPMRREFKQKTVTHISTGDSDDDSSTVSFKKRRFGNKNVRKRISDD